MAFEFQKRSAVRNEILSSLAVAEFSSIRPYLEPVQLKERTVLQEPGKRIEHIHFVEAGIISLRTLAIGGILETALVGRYGAVGASVALGVDTSMHRSIVMVPGRSLRIRSDDLCRLMGELPQIRGDLLRYIQALMIHASQTALCGVRHGLEQRLACWLCIACDALDGDVIPMTHDHLSIILGLRRSGLTESLIRFEQQGLIRKARGILRVCERELVRKKACSCYDAIASAYFRARAPAVNGLDIRHSSRTILDTLMMPAV